MNAGRCGTFSFIAFRLFIALTVLSICSVKAAEWDSEGAQQAFLKAEELSKGLDKHPEAPVDEYLRCARTYRKVYFKDPHYAQSGNAIYLEGILYQKMGGIFGEPDYYRLAIKRFKFLVSDYGGNEHCRDSLKRIGDIYSENMGDMAAAASAYDLLEKRYPLSGPKSTSSNTIKAEAPVRPENQDATVNKPPVKRRSVVQDIRHWASNDYTRLIIDLDSDAHWKKNLIRNPDRMYFDIDGASLSEKLHGKVFAIQDKFLKQVRVGQFNPDTVRIVLDFSSFSTYSIFNLEDPCRIVIDLHRHPLEQEKISKSPNLSNRSESSLQPADVQDPVPDTAAAEDASDIQVADSTIPQTEIPSALAGKTVPLADLIHKDFPDSPKAAEPTSQGRRTLTRVLGLKIGRIVIDPGHGGHDLGTVGPGGSVEKDLVLKLALRLKEILNQKLGADVVLTRDKDIFVSLEERTKIANEKRADLFLSIHANSSRYSSISGVETYYLDFAKTDSERIVASRENAGTANSINNLESLVEQIAQADKSTESKELASIIQTSLYHGAQGVFPSTKNRGVRSAPFIVLIGAKMPSILTEVAFISNPKDEAKLSDEKNLEQLAEALFSGIEAYMKKLGNYPIAYRAAQTQ